MVLARTWEVNIVGWWLAASSSFALGCCLSMVEAGGGKLSYLFEETVA